MLFQTIIALVQLLPSFFGYIFIIYGVRCLRKEEDSRGIRRVFIVTLIMIALTLTELFFGPEPLLKVNLDIPLPVALLSFGLISGLMLLFIYDLLNVSAAALRLKSDFALAEDIDGQRRVLILLYTLRSVAVFVYFLFSNAALATVIFICEIVLLIWLAAVFMQLKRSYDASIES